MAWSPVIKDTRQDRINEGEAGYARDEDETAATPTRASLDSGKAAGLKTVHFRRHFDTTQTDKKDVPYDISNS